MIMFIIRENVFTVLAPTDEAFAGCFFQTIIYHSPYQLSWFQPPELLSQNWHNLTGRSWFRDEGKAFCGENCCWAGDQFVTSVVTSVWPVCDQCVTSVWPVLWPVCDQCVTSVWPVLWPVWLWYNLWSNQVVRAHLLPGTMCCASVSTVFNHV